jgi:excinuclease UvrABC nuclease subunit
MKRFDLNRPPAVSGVYAIRSGYNGCRWHYIGQSKDIAARVRQPNHPAQITRGLEGLTYWFRPMQRERFSEELRLIRTHTPDWNGGTQWSRRMPSCAWFGPLTDEEAQAVFAVING